MSVLTKILESKRAELRELRQRRLPAPPPLRTVDLSRAAGAPMHLIAEIKLKSPSAGHLDNTLDVAERAQAYEAAGASMISVLCDGPFFGGSFENLSRARDGAELPLLCKEFIIDEAQLDAAQAYGASAALLIVRCLGAEALERLIAACHARDLVPLVEVFTDEEATIALDAGASHIGVNARDLDTLEMNPDRASRVLAGLPTDVVRAHFSGMKDTSAVRAAAATGAHAALIGEILMRQSHPTQLLQTFVRAAR